MVNRKRRVSEFTRVVLELAQELHSFSEEAAKVKPVPFMMERTINPQTVSTRLNSMTQEQRIALHKRLGTEGMLKLVRQMYPVESSFTGLASMPTNLSPEAGNYLEGI